MGEAARRFSTRFKMRKMVQARPIRIPRPTRVIRSVGSTRGWTSSISDASSSERSSRPRATRRATFEATSSTCARNFLPCFLRCSRASKLDAAGLSGLKDTILKGIEALNQQVATAAEFAESGKNHAHDGARTICCAQHRLCRPRTSASPWTFRCRPCSRTGTRFCSGACASSCSRRRLLALRPLLRRSWAVYP